MNLPEKNSKKYREFFISSNSIIKMQTDFIPIDYDYFDFDGRNFIRVIGRNPSGKRICVIDSCDVYLWAILKDKVSKEKINNLIEKILKIKIEEKSSRKTKVEKVELCEKNFLGKKIKALKIFATNYKDLHDIADKLGMPEIEKRRGYDLGFITHYIIEKKISPLNWYEILIVICVIKKYNLKKFLLMRPRQSRLKKQCQIFGWILARLPPMRCLTIQSIRPS